MPNPNKVAGLSPIGYIGGADWDGKTNLYYVPSSNTDRLSIGDPVKLAGDADANGIPSVQRATAGATFVGVINGIGIFPGGPFVDPANLDLIQAPATKTQAYYLQVIDDPNVIFEIQEDGVGGTLTSASVGQNADFIAADPATGVRLSAFMLDSSTAAVTSTLNLKILGLVRRADNAFGANAKFRVLMNNHSFRTGIAGI
jgi:hypothetical protein